MRGSKRKRVYIIWGIVFVAMLLFIVTGKVEAASSVKIGYKTKERSTSYSTYQMNAEVSYKMVILKGKSTAIRKINKAIENDCKKFLYSENANALLDFVGEMNQNGEHDGYESLYFYRTKSKVTYNRRNIISIRMDVEWFEGGILDTSIYGMTFDLRTGKKLGLEQVCSGTSKQIRNRIIKTLEKRQAADNLYLSDAYKYKLEEFDFYLKPGNKAMICFDSYELGLPGVSVYAIKSKYK